MFVAVEEQLQMAFNLSLAALLGEDVYNFGELVRMNIRQVSSSHKHLHSFVDYRDYFVFFADHCIA